MGKIAKMQKISLANIFSLVSSINNHSIERTKLKMHYNYLIYDIDVFLRKDRKLKIMY